MLVRAGARRAGRGPRIRPQMEVRAPAAAAAQWRGGHSGPRAQPGRGGGCGATRARWGCVCVRSDEWCN